MKARRELRQRINAKEAEIELEEGQPLQKTNSLLDPMSAKRRRTAKREKEAESFLRRDS